MMITVAISIIEEVNDNIRKEIIIIMRQDLIERLLHSTIIIQTRNAFYDEMN